MSMTSLTAQYVPVSEVTSKMVDELVDGSYVKGHKTYNKHYLDVVTSRGKNLSVTVFVTNDGDRRWYVYNPRSGSWSSDMTKELMRVFQPERAKRMDECKRNVVRISNTPDGTVKVGSIFAGCYGYDATLWNFYQVTSMTPSGLTCTVQELHQETKDDYGPCNWLCRPIKDSFAGKPEKHRISYGGTPSIKITSFEHATLLTDSDVRDKWFNADNYH